MTAAGTTGGTGTVLVVNAGSSSLKYQLRAAGGDGAGPDGVGEVLAKGTVEELGGAGGGHDAALTRVLDDISAARPGALDGLVAVGHRVVHGGTRFTGPTLVDDEAERGIDELSALAPLHNPPQLAAVRALRARLPAVPQVAVFDTAFHATVPEVAATYALPVELAQRYGVRRYGFHGTSHRYVTRRAAEQLGTPLDRVRLVTCHVGNGVSVTAVQDGRSVDTSMGLTPLEGAVMGTRSGDLDPAVVFYLGRRAGLGLDELDELLNQRSGLKGLTGESDLRAVHALADGGDERAAAAARLGLAVYAYRLRKYVAAYLGVVPGVQAVVFTGGVGEKDPEVRDAVTGPLAHLGVGTSVAVMVVPTDEEAEIAGQALEVVGAA